MEAYVSYLCLAVATADVESLYEVASQAVEDPRLSAEETEAVVGALGGRIRALRAWGLVE